MNHLQSQGQARPNAGTPAPQQPGAPAQGPVPNPPPPVPPSAGAQGRDPSASVSVTTTTTSWHSLRDTKAEVADATRRQTQASFACPVISKATRWVERVLGREWATPAAESRPRAQEVNKLKIEQVPRWLASIHADDKVSAADAAVLVTLLACSGLDICARVGGRFPTIDLLVAISLQEPAQTPSDKTVAMFKALVHTLMQASTTQLDPASRRPWPSPPLRMALASQLAVPVLSQDPMKRYYQEQRRPALTQALVRALCPPTDTHPQQATDFLAGIDGNFSPWPVAMGKWQLAQGVEAVLSARAQAKDPDTKQGGAGPASPGNWQLAPDAAMRHAPLAVPATPSQVMDQAHRVFQLHAVALDSGTTANAALAVLRERILSEGRDWPVQVLIAAVCGYAAYNRQVAFDSYADDPQAEFEEVLASDMAWFLKSPLAAGAAVQQAIAQGFALAADPLRCLSEEHFDVARDLREPLITAALSLVPAQNSADLLQQLDYDAIVENGPFVACATLRSLLRFGVQHADAKVLAEVRSILSLHIRYVLDDLQEEEEGWADEVDPDKRRESQKLHAELTANLAKLCTQEIPAVYEVLVSQLRQTWMTEAPAWTAPQQQEFCRKVRGLAVLLRQEAAHWKEPDATGQDVSTAPSAGVRRVAQDLEALANSLRGQSVAVPDDGAPPAFDDALVRVGAFRTLMERDPGQAQRTRAAILALLRAHDGLAIEPGRAAQVEPLVRLACDTLSARDAGIAMHVLVRLGGGAQLAADLLDKLVAIALVRKAGMAQTQYAEQATRFLLLLFEGMLPGDRGVAAAQDEGAEALATTVFLTSTARHLLLMADPVQRLALVVRFTDTLLVQLNSGWQAMFLRELLQPALKASDGKAAGPGAPGVWVAQANFLAIATGLASAHKGLNRQDWSLLLDHLLETKVSDPDLQRVCHLLLDSAHLLVAPPVEPGRVDPAGFTAVVVRQLLERPDPIPALARVMQALLGAFGVAPLPVAGPGGPATEPKDALGSLMGRMVLAKFQSPEAAGRLMAALTLALRRTPTTLVRLQQWLWDAVGGMDAELVVAGLEDDDIARLNRLQADAMMRIAVLGAGYAFGLGWGARPALDAAALRASLTVPPKSAVQPDVQAALWRGALLAPLLTGRVHGKPADAAQAWTQAMTRLAMKHDADDDMVDDADDDELEPDDAEDLEPSGSKSRRVAGGDGRDRRDAPDPGYSEKRKTRRPKPDAMPVSPLVMERLPVSAREIDSLGDAPAPLRQALHAMLEAFGGEGTPKVPIHKVRKALAEWLGPQAQFEQTAAAPANRRHPADAAAVGDLLERLFADTMARLDGWLQAQMKMRADLAPMAQSLAREIAQWRALNTPHARRITTILQRVWDGLDTYLRGPGARPQPGAAPR